MGKNNVSPKLWGDIITLKGMDMHAMKATEMFPSSVKYTLKGKNLFHRDKFFPLKVGRISKWGLKLKNVNRKI